MDQQSTPLFQVLQQFTQHNPVSFHVPGHKNGAVFPEKASGYYNAVLKMDMTELTGLDDLHAPEGPIADAERLAASYFQSAHTYFLVGGSTAGNLAMIMATCSRGDKVIVQRNSHKSIMNGLELRGANPIFISPAYEESVGRFTNPEQDTLQEALNRHPDAKAVVLTYPDYFGGTFPLKEMIDLAHYYDIPVLVDEAHGVHFSLGEPFPASAISLGADVVVQSAHKMAPAMTMASFLHHNSSMVSRERISHYLQLLQSSSPSYPLMASLDIARAFLATMSADKMEAVMKSVKEVKNLFEDSENWSIIPAEDPLKITLHVKHSAKEVAGLFEEQHIFPELQTEKQILFIHGLAPFRRLETLKKAIKTVNEQLKNRQRHDTIDIVPFLTGLESITELAIPYTKMDQLETRHVPITEAVGRIAAEAVIPYPPGIPLILKGERIKEKQLEHITQLQRNGVRLQQRDPKRIAVFRGSAEGAE
ncbi:aminotransferase class I/II-fold pyridoxal phosphate-dependent enzyme [Oceanobacillus manasiensis]|uniref:aminotransferase class I/II-fold pyridoxal phosphate-dependent enzyme n=1 Tax=Oceanobacillus manasiensis TaxID=586413 RepID=UPI0005AAB09C|nr:aminotransferase class I/II-fold pyridoxal phosphate-dependent enzyme [Oceanobacillus manasiensis]